MTNDIMSRLNEAIATAQMQCEDGCFHDDEWDIVISEKLHNKLKEECGVVHVNSVEEIQRYNAIDVKVVPNWLMGSDVLLLVKKRSFKDDEISF